MWWGASLTSDGPDYEARTATSADDRHVRSTGGICQEFLGHMHPPFHCVEQRSNDHERTQTFVRARATARRRLPTAARHRNMRLPCSLACAALVALGLPTSAQSQ